MRYVVTFCFYLALAGVVLPHISQTEPMLYNYKINGRVVFNKYQAKKGATVYILSNRPINGRIPFTHADEDGKFSIEFRDVPGEYTVYAHEGETGGMLPLATTPEEAKKMQIKQGNSKPIRFDKEDSEQRVIIKLK